MTTLGSGQSPTDAINQIYQSVLRREADPTGLGFWEAQLNAGSSLNSIRDAFVASPETTSVINPIGRMGKIFAVFACLSLTGCIAPPIVSYVSMALDGASFITTGKSVGDHALSVAINEDCALLRVITEQDVAAVCREYPTEDPSEDQQEAATESKAISEWVVRGTPMDGEPFEYLGCDLWEFRDGYVTKKNTYWKFIG